MTDVRNAPVPPPRPDEPPSWMRPLEAGEPPPTPDHPPGRRDGRRRSIPLVALFVALAVVVGFVGGRVVDGDGGEAPLGSGRPSPARPASQGPPPVDRSRGEPVAAVAAALVPSVVQIETARGVGSGVVYDRRGLILTAAHVVQGAGGEVVVRLADGTRLPGVVVGTDPGTDVGVVRVDGSSLTPADLAVGVPVQVGQLAVAIGSPFGLEGSVTAGIVSAVDRAIPAADGGWMTVIQTDAPINPGNSGGALADRRGRVIGINDSIRTSSGTNSGVGFAIPIDIAVTVAEALVRGETPRLGYLGVSGREPVAGPGGALVTQVVPGSPADRAGLRPGDRIVRLDGEGIEGISALAARVRRTPPGTVVTLEVIRDGRHVEIEVEVGGQ